MELKAQLFKEKGPRGCWATRGKRGGPDAKSDSNSVLQVTYGGQEIMQLCSRDGGSV